MCFDHSFAVAILQNGSLQTVQLIQSFEELWRKCDGLLNWISIVKFKHKKKEKKPPQLRARRPQLLFLINLTSSCDKTKRFTDSQS